MMRKIDFIILIGFMGAGKTEVGKILAKNKGFNFIDLDSLIEAQEGMSITEIFKQKGENYFRNIETEILKKIDNNKTDIYKIAGKYGQIDSKENKNWVISTGGGMPAFNGNMKLLKNIGITIYLKADAKTIYERIKSETHRPVLGEIGFTEADVAEKLKEREKFYGQADIIIYTEGLTASAAAEEIGIFLNKNKN
ncbi:MAG: shikimate kinase [Candidatus Acidulodesulfobacterium sp.]